VAKFQISKAGSPSPSDAQNLKTAQADWNAFRTVEGLQRKAGVPARLLRRLVLKEIADNGFDKGATVTVGTIEGGYFIDDLGTGLDPDEVAKMFSISRPLVSTKLIRLPTRGALGNGLRVVAGVVLASNGFLTVETRNVRLKLRPERDGSTTVVSRTPCKRPVGTRIEIGFGPELPEDEDALGWAKEAIHMARGDTYAGKSSPWWYDVPQFHELLSACGAQPVRELVANLDGCTGGRAGEIVTDAELDRMRCVDVERDQAARLLTAARDAAKLVNPKRLGSVGPEAFPSMAYAIAHDTALATRQYPGCGRGMGGEDLR
jgi:hypothetical protein